MKVPTNLILCAMLIGLTTSCRQDVGKSNDGTVAEGVIWYVEYEIEDGKTGGFTRINSSEAVPGGNGSWNVDAYGRLTRDYLIITRPQQKDLGPRIIPTHRLVDLQFGDGGLKKIDENRPK
jgi:hypothetical protein